MTGRAIVQFSGGAASYVAARLMVEEYGPENVVLLFADTLIEDEDLYRFNGDVQRRLNIGITRISDGRTPWDVFDEEGMIGNTRADLCSRILKRELLWGWLEENANPETDAVVIGFDANEEHRFLPLAKSRQPWKVRAPLIERGIFKETAIKMLEADGLTLPRLYRMGFPHNNCGGFCIKAGHASFALLLDFLPERYAEHEAREDAFRQRTGKDVSVMRDRSGDETTKPLTMRKFRERRQKQPGLIDWQDYGGCNCMGEE